MRVLLRGWKPAARAFCLLALGAATAGAAIVAPAHNAATPAPGGPAQWRTWVLLVDLKGLPHSYTCTELWYRFRDVLLAIGASPNGQILTYKCEATRAASSRSPSVQLEFQLPEALPASEARYADVPVVRTTVRLAPGTLKSFTPQDCELLKQISDLLLPALPVHVVGPGLSCRAPSAARHAYALEVQALIPRS